MALLIGAKNLTPGKEYVSKIVADAIWQERQRWIEDILAQDISKDLHLPDKTLRVGSNVSVRARCIAVCANALNSLSRRRTFHFDDVRACPQINGTEQCVIEN
ncbi:MULTISPECIES: hypothetical protein [Agrobacterium]|uniref:Uncharacterized protein n=1 Tax=Agrobacterium rosae TaxID=1972867 RepID=A0A1R3U3B7_9HYPH|nr:MULTISPECIES: hypothetical protein [Agrobacterium]SCX36166.1 hypothetical protein DSM25559_5344 [Agrobacterium rosae]